MHFDIFRNTTFRKKIDLYLQQVNKSLTCHVKLNKAI
jgi:hypothetical protein